MFSHQASKVFPGVSWDGESNIHVSVYKEGSLDFPMSDRAKILYSLNEHDIGGKIFDSLLARFEKFEWLLERDIFAKLFLIDIDLRLQGKPTSVSPNRVMNPATGNLFHRIAVVAPYVGAVRFWAEGFCGCTTIGYRFRIVKMTDESEEVDVRAEAREREAQVLLDVESAYSAIMEIQEPPKQVMAEVATLKII